MWKAPGMPDSVPINWSSQSSVLAKRLCTRRTTQTPPARASTVHSVATGGAHRVVETQRAGPHRLELGRRARVAAGEQRDIVTEGHELLGEPGNDALGASVQFRWDRLGQRCNLRDSHVTRLLVNAVAGHDKPRQGPGFGTCERSRC